MAGTQEWGSSADRQRANTKDEDPTGLLNEGFRYRDLDTGTFITRDPLGFVDGPNVYTYVVQNPWTFFDPKGLRKKNKVEEKALAKMESVAKSVDKLAERHENKANMYKESGNQTGEASSRASAKKEMENAENLRKSIKEIEKMIAASTAPENDPNRLKVLNGAFEKWNNSARQYTKTSAGTWGLKDQYKCNIYIYDILLKAGIINDRNKATFLARPTNRPYNVGKYNANGEGNKKDFFETIPFLKNGQAQYRGADGSWSGDASPGSVVSYGERNASGNGGHLSIAIGNSWYLSASERTAYGQSNGVNLNIDKNLPYQRRVVRGNN